MCLIVKSDTTIQVAEKDITCIKVVKHISKLLGLIKYWNSPMYNTRVKRKYNQVLTDTEHLKLDQFERGSRCDGFIICQGYHTFINEESSKNIFTVTERSCCKLQKAVIPKGAEYCIGEYGDIVSNQLIVFSSKKKFDKYVASKV